MNKVVDWFNHKNMAQLTYFKVTPGGAGGPTCEMPAEATTPTVSATEPTTAATTATAPANTDTTGTDTQQDSGNGTLVLIIALCALVAAGGGFALYWFVLRKPAEADEAEETEETEETEK